MSLLDELTKYSPQNHNLPNYHFVRRLLMDGFNRKQIIKILDIVFNQIDSIDDYVNNKHLVLGNMNKIVGKMFNTDCLDNR